jgi:LEA14-like dessication related protein
MKKYLLPFFYCLLSVVFFSCGEIKPVTMGGIENVNVKTFSTAGVDATFGVRIKNENNFAITVYPASFDAMVGGVSGGKIRLEKRVRIKANSDGASQFHVKSDFSKVSMADIAHVISMVASKSAMVDLKGDVKVGKWYYKKKFPVEFRKTINLSGK